MAALVTLTTDFGTRDSYVAEMKGVLISQGPKTTRLVDLSHDLEPFAVHEAALFLRAAVRRFPEGTVHLVVVDPGVGTSRRALVAQVGGQTLVGPDNSVFGYLFDGNEKVYEIDSQLVSKGPISSTFHGRDVFAPVAARLAAGAEPETVGKRIHEYQRLVFPMVEVKRDAILGRVIHVDRFGNLVTNVGENTLRGFLEGVDPTVLRTHVSDRHIDGLSSHYGECEVGEMLVVLGSGGLLEVAAREAHAGHKLGAEVGAFVRVERTDI